MKLIIQPGDGVAPIVAAIKHAKKTVDIVIFRFDRPEVETFPGETFGAFRSKVLEHYRLDAVVENRDIYRPRR